MRVKEVSITSLESWLSKIRSIRTWNAIIRVAERVLWHRPAAPRPQFPMPLSKIQSEIQKKNLRQRHPGWIFQGMLMPNTAACPAMWHFAGIQSQSRLTSSRCTYKHLKFTGQVLLNVVQRALKNEQVLEIAKSPAGNSKGLAAVETARSQKDVSGFTSQWLPIASQQWLAQWKVSNQRLPRLWFIGSVVACPQSGK